MKLPNLILTAFVGTALFGGGSSLEAAQIVGSITFAGGVNLNTSSAGTATAVTAWTGPGGAGSPFVLSSSLSAGAVPSFSSVTFVAPWSFASGPISSFWSVSGYTFDLLSSGIFSQGGSPASVSVTGTGTLKYAGFTDTPGSWSFSTQDPSSGSPANFSFSAKRGEWRPEEPPRLCGVAIYTRPPADGSGANQPDLANIFWGRLGTNGGGFWSAKRDAPAPRTPRLVGGGISRASLANERNGSAHRDERDLSTE